MLSDQSRSEWHPIPIPLTECKSTPLKVDDIILFFETLRKEAISGNPTAKRCDMTSQHFLLYLNPSKSIEIGQRNNLSFSIKMLCDSGFFTGDTANTANIIKAKIEANYPITVTDEDTEMNPEDFHRLLTNRKNDIRPANNPVIAQTDHIIESIIRYYHEGSDTLKKYFRIAGQEPELKNETLARAMGSFKDMNDAITLLTNPPNNKNDLFNYFDTTSLKAIFKEPCYVFSIDAIVKLTDGQFYLAYESINNAAKALAAIPAEIWDESHDKIAASVKKIEFNYFHHMAQQAYENKLNDKAIAYYALAEKSLYSLSPDKYAGIYYRCITDAYHAALKEKTLDGRTYQLELALDIFKKIPLEQRTKEANDLHEIVTTEWFITYVEIAKALLNEKKYRDAFYFYKKILCGKAGSAFDARFDKKSKANTYTDFALVLIQLALREAKKYKYEAALKYLSMAPANAVKHKTQRTIQKLINKYEGQARQNQSAREEKASEPLNANVIDHNKIGLARDDHAWIAHSPTYFKNRQNAANPSAQPHPRPRSYSR